MTTTTKMARLCLLIIAILALAGIAQAQKIPKAKPPKTEQKAEDVAVPALPQSPEQVDAFMGSLTDEKARQVLAQVLKRQTAAKAASDEDGVVIKGSGGLGAIFFRMADNASALAKKLIQDLHRRGGRNRRPGRCLAQADRRQGHRPLPADPAGAFCDRGGRVAPEMVFFPGDPGPPRTALDLCEIGAAGVFRADRVASDPAGPGGRRVRRHHLHPVCPFLPKR